MAVQKIAITLPPPFLKRLDQWAKKTRRTRSRFIMEEMETRLKILEDEEITRIYDKAFADAESLSQGKQLAEEMLSISAVHESEEKW